MSRRLAISKARLAKQYDGLVEVAVSNADDLIVHDYVTQQLKPGTPCVRGPDRRVDGRPLAVCSTVMLPPATLHPTRDEAEGLVDINRSWTVLEPSPFPPLEVGSFAVELLPGVEE